MSQTFSSRGLLPDRKPVSLLALSEGMAVGPARLVRDLGRCRGAYRWLGRVPSDASLFQVYVVPPAPAGGSMPPAVEAGDRVKAGGVVAELDSDTERIARDRAALQERLAADKVARMEQLTRSRTASAVT